MAINDSAGNLGEGGLDVLNKTAASMIQTKEGRRNGFLTTLLSQSELLLDQFTLVLE